MFRLIPGIGAFFWPILALLLAVGVKLPKSIRAPALYASMLSLIAVYVPLWHTLSSPNRLDVEYLIPTLRGDSLNFLTVLLAALLYFQTKALQLTWFIRGAGWAMFVFIILFGQGGVNILYGFENPSLSAFFVLLALGVETWETAIASLGAALYLHSWTTTLSWGVGMLMVHPNLWWSDSRGRPRWWAALGSFIAVGVGAVYFESHSFNRIDIWKKAWELYSQMHWAHIVFGTGPGCFFPWSQAYQGMNLLWQGMYVSFTQMHNDYFQIIFDLGIVGSLLVFYSMYRVYRMAGRRTKVHLAMLLVSMTIYFPLHFVPTLLLAIYWAREALYEIY